MLEDSIDSISLNDHDVNLRVSVIDAVVRLCMVLENNRYDSSDNVSVDKFRLRAAIAMALDLYHREDVDTIEMMNRLTSRD